MAFIIIVGKLFPNPYSFTLCPYYQSWHLLYLLVSFPPIPTVLQCVPIINHGIYYNCW